MKKLSFEEMQNVQGGMPCWAAKVAIIAAGISFTFFTVGWGTLAINVLGLALADWGYLETCFPSFFES